MNDSTLMAVLDHLAGLSGSVPGLLAFWLLHREALDVGWADPWPRRLAVWREHPDPDGRERALLMEPPEAGVGAHVPFL
ncbi:hypothetical protein [Allokutzneria oryzae]|uniref:Uncharacterized protein n=1 Tax=Allokutzneria oryzae TaxID=1378989 RepID=A0ABV5ZX46_9PSEU